MLMDFCRHHQQKSDQLSMLLGAHLSPTPPVKVGKVAVQESCPELLKNCLRAIIRTADSAASNRPHCCSTAKRSCMIDAMDKAIRELGPGERTSPLPAIEFRGV